MAAYAVFQIVAVALAVSIEKMVDYNGERVLVEQKNGAAWGGGEGQGGRGGTVVDVCAAFSRVFVCVCVFCVCLCWG